MRILLVDVDYTLPGGDHNDSIGACTMHMSMSKGHMHITLTESSSWPLPGHGY